MSNNNGDLPTYDSIAAELGITRQQAQETCIRALKKFRRELAMRGINERTYFKWLRDRERDPDHHVPPHIYLDASKD